MPLYEIVMEPPGSLTFETVEGYERVVDEDGNLTAELDESAPIVRERPFRRVMTVNTETEQEARRIGLKQCVDMADPSLNGPDEVMYEVVSITEK